MSTKDDLLQKVLALNEKELFLEVINLLPDEVLEDYKSVELYTERATAYWKIQNIDKANEDCNKALLISSTYAKTYNYIGNVFFYKKDFDAAIIQYNKAIQLQPSYDIAYHNRGVALFKKKEYKNAIASYTNAIDINKDYPLAFANRGNSWYALGEYENAIEDYNNAIDLNKNFNFLSYKIDLSKAKLGKSIKKSKYADDKTFYFIDSQIESLPEASKTNIRNSGIVLVEITDNIRKYAFNTQNIKAVAHYTKLKVADILIMNNKSSDNNKLRNSSRLRYSNVVSMNDPEEGKILLQYLSDNANESAVEKSFNAGSVNDENNIYLGSFLPAVDKINLSPQEINMSHEDDLVMWCTYGKDENKNEAAGCCIVINSDFFEKNNNYIYLGDFGSITEEDFVNQDGFGQTLYRVLYYNKRDGTIIGDEKDEMKEYLHKFKTELNKLIMLKELGKSDMNLVIDTIVYKFISEVRYFFKSADYSFENELRVIQCVSAKNNRVKIDDSGFLPRSLYIESTKELLSNLLKVVLGPKVSNPERWLYLEVQMRKNGYANFKVKPSICKYQ